MDGQSKESLKEHEWIILHEEWLTIIRNTAESSDYLQYANNELEMTGMPHTYC